MHEEKEPSRCVSWTTEQGKEKEPLTRGEREAFEALKRSAKETLGICISGQSLTSSGYLGCWIRFNGKKSGTRVHRIIMMVHLKKMLSPKEEIHHKNGNKRDNRIENLEVLSISEHKMATAREGKAFRQKLNFEAVLQIKRDYRGEYGWMVETAKKWGVNPAAIRAILEGRSYAYLKVDNPYLDRFPLRGPIPV